MKNAQAAMDYAFTCFEAQLRAAAWQIVGEIFETLRDVTDVEPTPDEKNQRKYVTDGAADANRQAHAFVQAVMAAPKTPKNSVSGRRGTLPVVVQVMKEHPEPLSARQIYDYADGRITTTSRLPCNVIMRDLAMDLVWHGDRSIFERVDRGRYRLRAQPEGIVTASEGGEP